MLIRHRPGLPDRVGRIVEVEAYGGPEDLASHARAGRTLRTATMFGTAGHAYVYLIYGLYHCLNVVTGPTGEAGAVLIRAVEPVAGIESLRADATEAHVRRQTVARSEPAQDRHLTATARLASGPGRLCSAFGVDRSFNDLDLLDRDAPLRLAIGDGLDMSPVVGTPRIGVGRAGEPWASLPWRLIVVGSPSLSGPSSANQSPGSDAPRV